MVRRNEKGVVMSNSWFRMYSEAVDDEKLRLLAFEDRWHFVALLCCKNADILDNNDPLMRRKVAVKLGLDLQTLEEVARRLSEVGLIDRDTLQPFKWDDRQFKSDSSKERVQKFREKQKKQETKQCNDGSNGYSNVTVTCQESDTDTDTELKPIDTNVSIVGNDQPVPSEQEKPLPPAEPIPDESIPDCPHQEIISLYAKRLPMGIQPKEWDGSRAAALKTRWREKKKRQSLDWWDKFFEYVSKSKFLTGQVTSKDRKTFEITLPWILKAENFNKIIDGVYH